MSREQPTTMRYSLWYPLAVETSSRFYISRDDYRRHTSSTSVICSQLQNDDSSHPGHSKQPDGLPSKEEKGNDQEEQGSGGNCNNDQNSAVTGAESAQAQDTEQQHWIFLQPETHLITEEQLRVEVRAIYAGLAMVEERCIDHQQSDLPSIQDQWQVLFSLHQLLLNEHNNFFLASQHPSASLALKQLSEKYAMPAWMWHHGIHSLLELMRHQLPDSLEHLLRFFYLAYSMITLLLENVPAFEGIWIECLDDLARYRMAIEDSDSEIRKIWANVARNWYHQVADKNPDVGRIHHHLAVLARPDILQQLFHYTKSLVSVCPFPNAGESILLLFDPLLDGSELYGQPVAVSAFVAAHAYLFKQRPLSDLKAPVQEYLSQLK